MIVGPGTPKQTYCKSTQAHNFTSFGQPLRVEDVC